MPMTVDGALSSSSLSPSSVQFGSELRFRRRGGACAPLGGVTKSFVRSDNASADDAGLVVGERIVTGGDCGGGGGGVALLKSQSACSTSASTATGLWVVSTLSKMAIHSIDR
jgi:hypothetical protein